MKKGIKIREVKAKIKIIREINEAEGEGDKEINELTAGEMPVSEEDIERVESVAVLSEFPVRAAGASATLGGGTQSSRAQEEETDNRPLYDVGRAMGGEASERQYKPVDNMQTLTLREVNVGRDFSMGSASSGGDYPDAERTESRLRSEAEKSRREYEEGRMEGAETGGGRRRRYPR